MNLEPLQAIIAFVEIEPVRPTPDRLEQLAPAGGPPHRVADRVLSEIRAALLRNAHTPLARALEFARKIPPAQLRDILHTSRLPVRIKGYLRKEMRPNR